MVGKSVRKYAKELEQAFRIGDTYVCADEFEEDFSFALEQAVSFFLDYGYMSGTEGEKLLSCCETEMDLEHFLNTDDGTERIEDLVRIAKQFKLE